MGNKSCISKHPSGVYRVGETRVSLDLIVYSDLEGESPEAIAKDFPVLTMDEVNGAMHSTWQTVRKLTSTCKNAKHIGGSSRRKLTCDRLLPWSSAFER